MAADAFNHPRDKLLTILTVGDQDIGVVVVHKATFLKIRLCELSLTQPYEISQKLGTGDAGGYLPYGVVSKSPVRSPLTCKFLQTVNVRYRCFKMF